MAELQINRSLCVGCGVCQSACAAGALSLSDGKIAVSDACVLCGVCVDACALGALSLPGKGVRADTASYRGIMVFCEVRNGAFVPVAYELLCAGRALADEKGVPLIAVAGGPAEEDALDTLAGCGADHVLCARSSAVSPACEAALTAFLCAAVKAERPEILLIGATSLGRSLAPRTAARLRTGLTADCTKLSIDPETGLLLQTRPAFGGNLMATISTPACRPQMASVRPGVMAAPKAIVPRPCAVTVLEGDFAPESAARVVASLPRREQGGIQDARVIVTAGRGIGPKKNMALVHRLAQLLGGAVGVSRPLVDAGYGDYGMQIGQTGASVAPELLILCGVSGAVQHVAGIQGAKTIVAINKDPDAPIFSSAHYAVVGDCAEVLTALIEALS